MKYLIILLLLPLSLFANYPTDNCNHFDLDNYKTILDKQISGLYKNPFNNNCFLMNFGNKNEELISLIPTDNPNIVSYVLVYLEYDSLFVSHIHDKEKNEYFNLFNFNQESQGMRLMNSMLFRNKVIQEYSPEIFFLHEIYHLKELEARDYRYDEIYSDIFAALLISKINNFNKDKTLNLIQNLSDLRINSLDPKFKNDLFIQFYYNKSITNIMKHFSDIQTIKSFKELENIIKKVLTK